MELKNKSVLKLKPGEIVEVKTMNEIAKTLDEHGAYEGLVFTIEMQKYCGRKFRVLKRVNKLLVEGVGGGLRRIKNAVMLDGAFCPGMHHGGCGKSCLLIWKEIWLKRVKLEDHKTSEPIISRIDESAGMLPTCQEISLIRATCPIKVWSIWHYFWEISSTWNGRTAFLKKAVEILKFIKFRFNLHTRSGKFFKGERKITPIEVLNLKPGETVEVKSMVEILKTLDFEGRNRGLGFMPEMMKYCGKKFRVFKRVDKMVIDTFGRMRFIPNTAILEGVYCDGSAHGGCQRSCFCLWREIWLKRVEKFSP